MCYTVPVWRSKNNFSKSIISFHHVRVGERTRVIRLGSKCLYQLRRLIRPTGRLSGKGREIEIEYYGAKSAKIHYMRVGSCPTI